MRFMPGFVVVASVLPIGACDGGAAATSAVVINELPWSPFGESEFVELKNNGDSTAHLGGGKLKDGADHELVFGDDVDLEPGARLVLVKDTDYDFGFSRAEEATLEDKDGTVIDSISWTDGDVPEGLSYGRAPDGDGDFSVLPWATPGGPNSEPDDNCPCCGPYVDDNGVCTAPAG
jgi:hypothetical protein